MTNAYKILFLTLMTLALGFGFMNHVTTPPPGLDFHRLHIFLFNLCTSSTIILYYSEGKKSFSSKINTFLILALAYALSAYLHYYCVAMFLALILAGIVESVRWAHFPKWPKDFFSSKTPVAKKFHHASLLCLTLGLIMSGMVILNNEFLKIISLKKLQLNTFFLGFSFPTSLITMSVIFTLMKKDTTPIIGLLKETVFWVVNLGVIIFFIFILAEQQIPQVIVTLLLFAAVATMLYLFIRLGLRVQQKNFLTSGMIFLVFTAITGILYIILEFFPNYHPESTKLLLHIHTFAALYGWNLSGLAIIFRYNEFPIKLHSPGVITLHWLTVCLLAPLGQLSPLIASIALICYFTVVYTILFSKGTYK